MHEYIVDVLTMQDVMIFYTSSLRHLKSSYLMLESTTLCGACISSVNFGLKLIWLVNMEAVISNPLNMLIAVLQCKLALKLLGLVIWKL